MYPIIIYIFLFNKLKNSKFIYSPFNQILWILELLGKYFSNRYEGCQAKLSKATWRFPALPATLKNSTYNRSESCSYIRYLLLMNSKVSRKFCGHFYGEMKTNDSDEKKVSR